MLPASEPGLDADASIEIQTPVVSVLDQVLALMQGLDAEQLAQIQAAATAQIQALAKSALDEAFAKAS